MADNIFINALSSALTTLFEIEQHTLAIFSTLKSFQSRKFCIAMEEQSVLLEKFSKDVAAEVSAHSYSDSCTKEERFRLSLSSICRLLDQIYNRRHEVTMRQAKVLNINGEDVAGCLMLKLSHNFKQTCRRIRLVNDEQTLISVLQLSCNDRVTIFSNMSLSLEKQYSSITKVIQAYKKLMKKQYDHLQNVKNDSQAALMIKSLEGRLAHPTKAAEVEIDI